MFASPSHLTRPGPIICPLLSFKIKKAGQKKQ